MDVNSDVTEATRIVCAAMLQACAATRSNAPALVPTKDRNGRTVISNKIERYWMGLLHAAFDNYYPKTSYIVLSKHQFNSDLRLNEYLYDLTVLRMRDRQAISPSRGKQIPVVQTAVWQVESEMAGSGRSVAIDLGKLTCGSAFNKLLIVRRPKHGKSAPVEKINDFINDVAGTCEGNFFVAYLPVYAQGHCDLDAHWLNHGSALPFTIYGRIKSGSNSEMKLLFEQDQ